jgi:hypothetical protein
LAMPSSRRHHQLDQPSTMTDAMSARSAWESSYEIVGSSGGALIGLQFVVITLLADRKRRTTSDTLGAFSTPTVVHLTGVLAIAAIKGASR